MRYICAIFCLAVGLYVGVAGQLSELVFMDLDNIPRHPLDPADKAASVLIFYWQDCPISNGYAPEINRICASHTNFAFYIVQVDSDLTPAGAREHAQKYELRAPVLLDPQHRLVKLAKATVTPEAVVLGKNGESGTAVELMIYMRLSGKSVRWQQSVTSRMLWIPSPPEGRCKRRKPKPLAALYNDYDNSPSW